MSEEAIHFEEFLKRTEGAFAAFRRSWLDGNQAEPEKWPLELPEADWHEQFIGFLSDYEPPPPPKPRDPAWDEEDDRVYEAMEKRIRARLRESGQRKLRVSYSAYEMNDRDIRVDNLDEVPVPGKVRVVAGKDDFYGGKKSKPYRGEILDSPTWLDLCVEANRMIATTRDEHHCFLEGAHIVDTEFIPNPERVDEVSVVELQMGS